MNEKYEKELSQLIDKMEKAEALAEKFPIFQDTILSNKITGEGKNFIDFGNRYKDLHLGWGIVRFYCDDKKQLTNYQGENPNKHLFKLYFNSYNLFDSDEDYGLEKLSKYAFYYDDWNSTFYVEDEQIETFLDKANEWYLKASSKASKESLLKEKKELEEQLKKLEERK